MERLLALILVFSFTAGLYGEIVEVRVDWNNVQCQPDCAKLLDKSFQKIKEVSDVSVSASDGVAILRWKANTPFKYYPIRAAFARVGIQMETMRLTVRGTITSNQKKFYLTSLGDGTKFHLLGTIQPSGNNFEPTTSPYNRPLTDKQIEQFREAQKEKNVVTVTGPILNPMQFPPLDLITERVNISE